MLITIKKYNGEILDEEEFLFLQNHIVRTKQKTYIEIETLIELKFILSQIDRDVSINYKKDNDDLEIIIND